MSPRTASCFFLPLLAAAAAEALPAQGIVAFATADSSVGGAPFEVAFSGQASGGNPGTTQALNFNVLNVSPFPGDGATSSFEIEAGGAVFTVVGDAAKSVDFQYMATSDTMLSFDYSSSALDELLHAVGFVTPTGNVSFQLHGSETSGFQEFNDYVPLGGNWTHFDIPLGDYVSGVIIPYFLNRSPGNPDARSSFANVKIYEAGAGTGYSYSWDFGDGSFSSPLQNPTHTYTVGGDYVSTLCVGDDSGMAFATVPITVTTPASFTIFGEGCPGSMGVPTLSAAPGHAPRIGETFQLDISGMSPTTLPSAMVLGLSNTTWGQLPLPLDLTQFGMWNCTLFVSADASLPIQSSGFTGTVLIEIPLNPFLIGVNFYVQAAIIDFLTNPALAVATNAGHGVIGT